MGIKIKKNPDVWGMHGKGSASAPGLRSFCRSRLTSRENSKILAQGLRVSLYSVFSGILTAIALTRFLGALLYGVGATGAVTFAMATALVLGIAVLAAAFPAWRATRIDPIKSLRTD
jgi:hypothetical protein